MVVESVQSVRTSFEKGESEVMTVKEKSEEGRKWKRVRLLIRSGVACVECELSVTSFRGS